MKRMEREEERTIYTETKARETARVRSSEGLRQAGVPPVRRCPDAGSRLPLPLQFILGSGG